MKVILQEDVSKLGAMGDVVKVRDGYGRNFLIPRGLAIIADEKNVRKLKHLQGIAQAKAAKELAESQAVATQLEGVKIGFVRESSDEEKLFGSVTSRDIEQELTNKGFAISRKNILLAEAIREFGSFPVEIQLSRGVKGTITVIVQK
ncbi:MAG: 50S ribosomal protein L9 [Deltaproteobacteria bacterium]|nr:50S ribosomal protein L9 [Deltaproteobacteria bacterium]